jgi:hypothetical protein
VETRVRWAISWRRFWDLQFRHAPATALNQQCEDQSALRSDEQNRTSNVPQIEIPEAQFTKPDDRPRRQPVLRNAPPAQLPPVEHVDVRADFRDRDIRGGLSLEDAQSQLSCFDRVRLEAENKSADNPEPNIRVQNRIDWRIGTSSDKGQSVVGIERLSGSVGEQVQVEDDRMVWKTAEFRLQRRHGKIGQVDDLYRS